MDVQRRMKLFNAWGSKHYDGVHWYPRIAVYDRRMGWDTQQHLGNELYGDFGTFDVDLDLPHHYVLDATGWLQNIDDVLPCRPAPQARHQQLQGQALERTAFGDPYP
jgi:hypothetical protein